MEQEKELQSNLNELESGISKQEAKGDEKDEALTSQLQSKYFHQKQQYDSLIEQFEADYPEYHQLKYSVTSASVQDLQSYLQETNTIINQSTYSALLSYHIADDKNLHFSLLPPMTTKSLLFQKPENFSSIITKTPKCHSDRTYRNTLSNPPHSFFDVLLRPVLGFPPIGD